MSQYSQRMSRLASRIFGDMVGPTNPKSKKVEKMFREKPKYMQPEIVDYYPNYAVINRLVLKLRLFGMYRDSHSDILDEVRRLNVLRGKTRPAKGQGRRAMRR